MTGWHDPIFPVWLCWAFTRNKPPRGTLCMGKLGHYSCARQLNELKNTCILTVGFYQCHSGGVGWRFFSIDGRSFFFLLWSKRILHYFWGCKKLQKNQVSNYVLPCFRSIANLEKNHFDVKFVILLPNKSHLRFASIFIYKLFLWIQTSILPKQDSQPPV